MLALFGVGWVCCCQGQTNFLGVTLTDALPIDGKGNCVDAPSLAVGETAPGAFCTGLARAELIIQLPPIPRGAGLGRATLGLYLQENTGSNGNPTFGAVSLYHNWKPNSYSLDASDYEDTNFVFVTNVLTPGSPTGSYYEMDVTDQIAKDYASDGATPWSNFRFQVDGLQYRGTGNHYAFSLTGASGNQPGYLNYLLVTGTNGPYRPQLQVIRESLGQVQLTWPRAAASFVLETSASLAGGWSEVTNEPMLVSGTFGVDLPASADRMFFRLRQR
jgi:hypothetical protein